MIHSQKQKKMKIGFLIEGVSLDELLAREMEVCWPTVIVAATVLWSSMQRADLTQKVGQEVRADYKWRLDRDDIGYLPAAGSAESVRYQRGEACS